MIRKYNTVFSRIIISVIALILTVISIKYLDAGIALRVMHFLMSSRTLHRITRHIPDILPHLVGIGTVLMWIIYLRRSRVKKNDIITRFLRLAATSLPAAYILKTFFKFVFGRTNPRSWLIERKPLGFHWFNETWGGSFPSGHMTVFTAFGVAVMIYFPQYRRLVLILLFLLGTALIVTNYHFLSDVIAGTYLGAVTTYFINYFYDQKTNNN